MYDLGTLLANVSIHMQLNDLKKKKKCEEINTINDWALKWAQSTSEDRVFFFSQFSK